jgi:hypothetical protein
MKIEAYTLPPGKQKNLLRFINRVEQGLTPIHIAKIMMFGSGLRGKPNPRDIDLVLIRKKDAGLDDKVEEFRHLINEETKTEEGRNSLAQLVTNADLARNFAKKTFPGLPAQEWFKYVRTTGDLAAYLPFHFDPAEVTNKVLKEGVRFVKIMKIVPMEEEHQLPKIMAARKFRQIWSESDRDVERALHRAHMPAERRNTIVAEMRNFLIQTERNSAQYEVVSKTIRKVVRYIQTNRAIPDDLTVKKYVETEASKRDVKAQFLRWILAWFLSSIRPMPSEPPLGESVTGANIDGKLKQIISSSSTIDRLSDQCEKMRDEIKLLHSKTRVVDFLLAELIGKQTGYGNIPIKQRIELAAYHTFLNVARYEADDETKRLVLKEVGLDETSRRIVLVERAYSRPWYALARSGKELRDLKRDAARFRYEKQLVAYLNPKLREAIPREIICFMDVSTNRSKGAIIPETLRIRLSVEGDRCNLLRSFAEKYGVKVERNAYECNASVQIDVRGLKGDKGAIKRLVAQKLGLVTSQAVPSGA